MREFRRVRVGDADLAFREAGDGPPILLVMGHTGTMDQWPVALVNGLARDRRVVTYDHRGFGESGDGAAPWSVEGMADDGAGLLEALGIPEADVLGWSLGGAVALEMALRHPGRIRRLALAASSAGGPEALLPDPSVLQSLHGDGATGADRARALLDLLFPADWRAAHADVALRFPVPRRAPDPADVLRQYRALRQWRGAADRLPGLGKRVLVIHGEQDVVTPPANALDLVRRIPGAWLARLPDAGHGLLHQCPSRVLRILRVFLED